jgi:predicted RNase H-like HicB family nuclease
MEGTFMQTVKIVYWQEENAWLGFLEEYPDYWTQGETLEDLRDHLKDLREDLTSGEIPGIRKLGDLAVP